MSQTPTPTSNAAQIDYWNAAAGPIWVQHQEQLDRQLAPLGREAMRVLAPAVGERILDIGCGCGQSTLEIAALVGPSGAVVGADISAPMLEVAKNRPPPHGAARLDFRRIDAQTGDLGRAAFDAAFSRFGVMFFSDPAAAFRNIRAALRLGGRLGFVCWRPFRDNPWMREPMEAAQPFLPPQSPMDPLAPGPFAFADAGRVRSILEASGFGSIAIEPFDMRIGGSTVEETLNLSFRVGPLGAALRERPELAEVVSGAVREVLKTHETPEGVLMPAAVWIVQARNPG